MRILWFTNTPSSASEKLNEKVTIGGWMISLEKHLANCKTIELGVAFPHGYSEVKNFRANDTEYFSFPYPKDKGIFLGLWDRLAHNIEPKTEIDYYLDIINQFKPDLIQIFGSERSFGLVIPQLKIPVLIHIQGNLTVYAGKWFSGLSNWDIFRYSNFKNLILGYSIWHQYFLFKKRATREQIIFSYCKYFLGRTDWDRRITKTLAPNSRYFHCEELLREEFFNAHWVKPENNKAKLFSVLSPSAYKGIETILETAILLKKNRLIDFEWHIAGVSSNDEIVGIIERKAHQKFFDNQIYLKGSLSADSLLKELLLSNCFIHPSHIENSANSICEAMLIGLPVIATYAGGTPSLINNGEEGLLIQDGDPYVLAGTIAELLNDSDLLNKISLNASARARKRHNPEKTVESLLSIYQTILKDK